MYNACYVDRRSMMELERSHAQLEDELHMLKYAGVKL